MEVTWILAISVSAAYFVGSIPFGILASKICGVPDPRHTGSGNIGFTNVLRVSGKTAGVLTLIGDMGKGYLAAWSAGMWMEQELAVLLVAFAVVAGHIFSVFLAFHGGKGVATALGVVAGLDLRLGLGLLVIWLIVVALWRYSSGGAVITFAVFPIVALVFSYSTAFVVFSVVVSGLILFRHRENIGRLLSGREGKIGHASS